MKSFILGSALSAALVSFVLPAHARDNYSKTTVISRPVQWSKIELRFVARQIDRLITDNEPKGHSIGYTADSYGELIDSQKKTIGRYDVISRATDVWSDGEMRMLHAEYNFNDGQDSFGIFGVGKFMANTGKAEIAKQHVFPVTGGERPLSQRDRPMHRHACPRRRYPCLLRHLCAALRRQGKTLSLPYGDRRAGPARRAFNPDAACARRHELRA